MSDEQRERAAFDAHMAGLYPQYVGTGLNWDIAFPNMWAGWQARAAQQAPQARAAILGWAVVNPTRGDRPRMFTDKLKAEYEAMWDGDEVIALAANPQQSNESGGVEGHANHGSEGLLASRSQQACDAQASQPVKLGDGTRAYCPEAGVESGPLSPNPQIASEPKEQT